MWQPFGICKLPFPGGMAGPQPGENVGPWDLCISPLYLCISVSALLMYRYWCEENVNFYLARATISVQSLSRVQLFVTPWTVARQASLSITNSRSLLKLMSIKSVMPSNHPLSSPSPPTFNLSQRQGLFQWVSSLHQVAKVLELQFQHQSFQWIFRTDFL